MTRIVAAAGGTFSTGCRILPKIIRSFLNGPLVFNDILGSFGKKRFSFGNFTPGVLNGVC